MLEWVFRRCNGESEAVETPIGLVPRRGRAQPRRASTSRPRRWRELTHVDTDKLRDELPQVEEHLARFGDRLPDEVRKGTSMR